MGREDFNPADFWAKVRKTDNCWIWTGYINKDGYGEYTSKFLTTRLTHRIAYGLVNHGEVPVLVLDHLCRNRACCNPGHLEPVTDILNTVRGSTGDRNRAKTHCPRGHEYSEENTYRKNGKRFCRTCKKDKQPGYDRLVRERFLARPGPKNVVIKKKERDE